MLYAFIDQCILESEIDDFIYDIRNFYDGVISQDKMLKILHGRHLDFDELPEYLQYKIYDRLEVVY